MKQVFDTMFWLSRFFHEAICVWVADFLKFFELLECLVYFDEVGDHITPAS